MNCILCLENGTAMSGHFIEIFSEKGLKLNVYDIISQHFFLRLDKETCNGQRICGQCWKTLIDFHTFYLRVAELHSCLDKDPCPQEIELKPEIGNINSDTLDIIHDLTDNFMDSEVKIENLDSLLNPELIPEVPQGQQQRSASEAANAAATKCSNINTAIVSEIVLDSKTEVALSVLFESITKTHDKEIEFPMVTLPANELLKYKNNLPNTAVPAKTRRGRSIKLVREGSTDSSTAHENIKSSENSISKLNGSKEALGSNAVDIDSINICDDYVADTTVTKAATLPLVNEIDLDLKTELSVSVLLESVAETSVIEKECPVVILPANEAPMYKDNLPNTAEPQKRRRGRPIKVARGAGPDSSTTLEDGGIKNRKNVKNSMSELKATNEALGCNAGVIDSVKICEDYAADNTATKTATLPIVKEIDFNIKSKLPLSVLLENVAETHVIEKRGILPANEGSIYKDNLQNTTEPPKTRRGRSKKVARAGPTDSLTADSENVFSGTDDSDSSSKCNSDSDESFNPNPKYAIIPKRKAVKPKNYRKLPKPLVSPKRMSRKEIEAIRPRTIEYDTAIKKFFERLECPKCELFLNKFSEIRGHFLDSHNGVRGYITCCGLKFFDRKSLADHIYLHWNADQFKCKTCEKVFDNSRTLSLHEETHIRPKGRTTFPCGKCDNVYSTQQGLKNHIFSKHIQKSEFKFTCTQCEKKFSTKRKLKYHVKINHAPDSTVICDICGKILRVNYLKMHLKLKHSSEPRLIQEPKQCLICGAWLRHQAGLKKHIKSMHEDQGREHRCKICNKVSSTARALRQHVYVNHKCEKRHKCTVCEKAFKRPQNLREHTSVHTGKMLYAYPNCEMTFMSSSNMYTHRRKYHFLEWKADREKPRFAKNFMKQSMELAAGKQTACYNNKIHS